jgi:LacI family transcriptional regulator
MSEQPPASTAQRPTLRSIAYLTGLGVSTVSRALRDDTDISEETRNRVKAIASQIGYRPNRAGVRLRTGKTNVISLVLNPQDGGSGFFANMVYGISDTLSGTAYHLVITPYSLEDPMSPVRYIVETNSADGIIISRTEPDDARVRYLAQSGMPFATHGRTAMGIQHAFVDYDSEAYARTALQQLKDRGRKRIALITPPPSLTYHAHMLQGFERGLAERGLAGFTFGSVHSDLSANEIRQRAAELVSRSERPDGFICSSAANAVPLITGLKDKGLELGRDYDLVAKPATDIILQAYPKILTINEDFRQAGRELTRMLLAHIGGEDPARLQMLQHPEAPNQNRDN